MQSPFVPALLRDRGLQAQDLGFWLIGIAEEMEAKAAALEARTQAER